MRKYCTHIAPLLRLRFIETFGGLQDTSSTGNPDQKFGYVDVRYNLWNMTKLEQQLQGFVAAGVADKIFTVSFGDEVHMQVCCQFCAQALALAGATSIVLWYALTQCTTGIVTTVALSPNGQQVASGGSRGELAVWNVSDPASALALVGHGRKGVNSSLHPLTTGPWLAGCLPASLQPAPAQPR